MFSTVVDCIVLVPDSIPPTGENRVHLKTQELELLKNKIDRAKKWKVCLSSISVLNSVSVENYMI